MKCNFVVGQKVVCITGEWWKIFESGAVRTQGPAKEALKAAWRCAQHLLVTFEEVRRVA
jgi:hypothetical protein